MSVDLEFATLGEIYDELEKRTNAGAVVLLLPEDQTSDGEQLWHTKWGCEWSVLGMLDHLHEMQRKFTTELEPIPDQLGN